MAMSAGREDGEPMMEMNTTPLIDVMLVLLIMFIITIPIQTHAVKVDLPQNSKNQPNPVDAQKNKITIDAAGTVVPFISIRQWQPVSSTETEVLSWFAVDRNAPETFKRDSYRAYLMCFGSSGMFEQDDVENWIAIMEGVRGPMGRRLALNYQMLPEPEPSGAWRGPGTAWAQTTFGEVNERALYERWLKLIS